MMSWPPKSQVIASSTSALTVTPTIDSSSIVLTSCALCSATKCVFALVAGFKVLRNRFGFGHQFAARGQKCRVVVDAHGHDLFGHGIHLEIAPQLAQIDDVSITLRPSVALLTQLSKVDGRLLVADGNIDLRLGQHIVGNLVVAPALEAIPFQIVAGEEMMYVAI